MSAPEHSHRASMRYEDNPSRLLILTTSQKHADSYAALINTVLEGQVAIAQYLWGSGEREELENLLRFGPQVILCSNHIADTEIQALPSTARLIRSDLHLNEPANLDQLFIIPPGERVLMVCPQKIFADQAIEMLERLGINHITYVSYWEGCTLNTDEYAYAVTTGTLELCPANIENKIDIGLRTLSIHTILKILEAFNVDSECIERYIYLNQSNSTKIYKELSEKHLHVQQLKHTLETITEGIDEALISIDRHGVIVELNLTAQKVIKKRKAAVAGRYFYDFLGDIPGLDCIANLESLNTIATINGNQLYIDYLSLDSASNIAGIIRLREISTIQSKDEQIRQLMHIQNQGHVARYSFDDIAADGPAMRSLKEEAELLARTPYPVLVTGETGTGKELFAQAVHNYSDRKKRPFVAINFAALPENLIESELFGYEEGAFTGARKSGKKGVFETAHTGSIFLDEIGDASLAVQTRLLRVLEEQVVMRVGDTKVTPVNVRIIAATNKNLKNMVREGMFRQDLYYRINTFQLRIPPLRERPDCIMRFIHRFSNGFLRERSFSPEAAACLARYDWPGNIRELRNVVNYISVRSTKRPIGIDQLPEDIRMEKQATDSGEVSGFPVILSRLGTQFSLDEIQKYMQIIATNSKKRQVLGREKIHQILNESCSISINRLRNLVAELRAERLIIVGKTKQGTVLAPSGNEFLSWLGTEKGERISPSG